jgi:hypothetical protein
MASVLDRRFQAARLKVRHGASERVQRVWNALPHYDEANVAEFVGRAVPIVGAARKTATHLTDAYLSLMLKRPPIGLTVPEIRNGVDPDEVYKRPFVNVWTALGKGVPYEQAVAAGLARAASTADMDVALTSRAATVDYAEKDSSIVGWERVPDDDACDFCLLASTQQYGSSDLMPLHNFCNCSQQPITGSDSRAGQSVLNHDLLSDLGAKGVKVYDGGEVRTYGSTDPAGMVVQEHGELGPVITKAGDSFAGPDDIS